MDTLDKSLAPVREEVGKLAHDTKKTYEEMNRSLEQVRSVVNEVKNKVDDPVIDERIKRYAAEIVERQNALEEKSRKSEEAQQKRLDSVEVALRRAMAAGADGRQDERKDALEFSRMGLAVRGALRAREAPTIDNVDADAYRAYELKFDHVLRFDSQTFGAEEAKALSVGSDPDGGYLMPASRSARMITRIYEASPIRELATVETIGGTELEVPIDVGEADCEWVGETTDPNTDTTPQTRMQKIPVHEMAAKPKITSRALEDAGFDIEGWLTQHVADRFARKEATAFVSGDGVAKPRGILSYPASTDADAGAGRRSILQIATGKAAALSADSLASMPLQIKSDYLRNAVWLMNRGTVAEVVTLKDGQGQYLWRPGLESGTPATLRGFPVRMADDMPLVSAGNLVAAFGDFARGYTVVDRLGVSVLRDPYTAKPHVVFYTRRRVGGDVVDFQAFALLKVAASI